MVSTTDESEHRSTIVHTFICQKPMIDVRAPHYSPIKLESSVIGFQGNVTIKSICKAFLKDTTHTKFGHYISKPV